jgi:hypothetical protein
MDRRGPLYTLGSVVVLAAILLAVNLRIAKSGTVATSPAVAASSSAPATSSTPGASSAKAATVHALFAGRTSGNEVTVTVAINGGKADGFLNPGQASQVLLQGSATGGQVTLTSQKGPRVVASFSGAEMFGTISGFLGQNLPFSAQQAVVESVYSGRSSGNQVTVAIATEGNKAAAYVCNGKTVEAWLQGSVNGNQLSLTGNNGAGLTGSMSGLNLFGTVTPSAGVSFPFAAALSPHPAGVYQARIEVNGLATRIGWAVLPDGTQVGIAVEGKAKVPAPALNLSNGSFTLDGSSFTASLVAGQATVVLP